MPKKIDPEVQARAVRLVADHLSEYSSLTAASAVVAKQVGVGRETVRRCLRWGQNGLTFPHKGWTEEWGPVIRTQVCTAPVDSPTP